MRIDRPVVEKKNLRAKALKTAVAGVSLPELAIAEQ
jgi:hypothetical protein